MANVYVLSEDGTTEAMESVFCKNEDKELQSILEKNFNLLPGDQIEPDAPCRWLLIKREMPVPDWMTGVERWSIDFLFVDQTGIPTFVECKRFADTRSRREVVGQVLEYAANAQHLWSKEVLRDYAEATAKKSGKTLEDCLRDLHIDDPELVDEFFSRIEENLKKAVIRIIFYLEQAPEELKRLVEFLNTQMVSSDVLLVEARQFRVKDVQIIVPRLFGFTEQARKMKSVSVERERRPVASDWESFLQNVRSKGLDEASITAMRKLYDVCDSLSARISWGRGKVTGSFSPQWATLSANASPFSVYADGKLEMHFPSLQVSEPAKRFSDELVKVISGACGLAIPDNYLSAWFSFMPAQWVPKIDPLVRGLETLINNQKTQSAGA